MVVGRVKKYFLFSGICDPLLLLELLLVLTVLVVLLLLLAVKLLLLLLLLALPLPPLPPLPFPPFHPFAPFPPLDPADDTGLRASPNEAPITMGIACKIWVLNRCRRSLWTRRTP